MPATPTVFEHDPVEGKEWSHADFVALARLNNQFKSPLLLDVIHNGKRTFKATQHVGVIRLRNHTIQVLPKIYRSATTETKTRAQEATSNLLHMLSYAGDLPIREHTVAPLLSRGTDWFEILTHLFATHLMQEWQRGVVRGYVVIEDELPTLRGKWRLTDQLRRPERKHLFAVAYDEFTADNPLNRVFRFVVERLWHITRDPRNRQTLGELRQWLEEVTLPTIVRASDADPARILTRVNERYRPLLNLARLFLDDCSLQLAAGDLSTFAFVFDMNALFEAFIVGFIRRHRDEVLPPEMRDSELRREPRGNFLARRDGRRVFELKPDLALLNPDRSYPLLLDTKYKRLEPSDHDLGISSSDFYQMCAYARRYQCPRVVLIYPQMADISEQRAVFRVQPDGEIIEAATVDLRPPLRETEDLLKTRLRDVLAIPL